MKKILTMKNISMMILMLLSCILVVHSGYAYPSGHIGLLTVSELANNTQQGGTADLYLVVKPGSGRIFIDSFPLSKIDTQITMRFASEVACDLLDKDCSGYDFFYTITANSAVVGGPSAGAAATVLTVAVLDNKVLDNKTIMTGTIDSGNLIGPVSGIPAKAFAAQMAGYTHILIPEWDIANDTPDSKLSIKVTKVSTLEDALYYFTGKNYTIDENVNGVSGGLSYSKDYTQIMSKITLDLCTKYGSISNNTLVLPNMTSYGINITNSSQDNFVLALNALHNNSYYSAASFCFGGNVKILNKLMENFSNNELKLSYAKLLGNISIFESGFKKNSESISTISQLEAYMIVAERLSDTKQVMSNMNPENISTYQLAYAIERFDTAVEWSKFSQLDGQKFAMDENLLKVVCTKKLSEAEERLNYLEIYYPSDNSIRDELSDAYNYYNQQDYALCIFTSSKVKADSDVVLSAIFVPDNDTSRLLDEKISAAQRVITRQEQANIFPILGYSYYEYANTLKGTDKYSALLYSEYALELSNLEMYFKKKDALTFPTITFNNSGIGLFLLGLSVGILVAVLAAMIVGKMRKKDKKRKRR